MGWQRYYHLLLRRSPILSLLIAGGVIFGSGGAGGGTSFFSGLPDVVDGLVGLAGALSDSFSGMMPPLGKTTVLGDGLLQESSLQEVSID